MRVLLIAVLCAAVSAAVWDATPIIDGVNRRSDLHWEAGPVAGPFAGKTKDEIRSMFSHDVLGATGRTPTRKTRLLADLPTNFSAYEAHPDCPALVRMQGSCGSCWAHGTTEALSDRFCMQGGGEVNLSPQYLVSCEVDLGACAGGAIDAPWEWFHFAGVPTEDCMPYVSGIDGLVPDCPTACEDGSDLQLFTTTDAFCLPVDPEAIMAELYANGPLSAVFVVYMDLVTYKSGVYQWDGVSDYTGGHMVELVGWGETAAGVPYWLLKNSWSAEWGDGGFFKMLRGAHECGIEAGVCGGTPNLDKTPLPEPELPEIPHQYTSLAVNSYAPDGNPDDWTLTYYDCDAKLLTMVMSRGYQSTNMTMTYIDAEKTMYLVFGGFGDERCQVMHMGDQLNMDCDTLNGLEFVRREVFLGDPAVRWGVPGADGFAYWTDAQVGLPLGFDNDEATTRYPLYTEGVHDPMVFELYKGPCAHLL